MRKGKSFSFATGMLIFVLLGQANAIEPVVKKLPPVKFVRGACPKSLPALKRARCGFLIVPENRTKYTGRQIRLAVAIIPSISKSPPPDPIVYLVGGPGGSALSSAQQLIAAGLNRNRNLILMDQRGTTHSKPALLCPEIDRFRRLAIGLSYDAASTGSLFIQATQDCYDRLTAAGIELGAYNTTENADDFADLRVALGIKEWNVYGVSYGTDLALSYMRNHPEGIRSVTIDSVVPPNLVTLGMFWTNARVGLENIFNVCAKEPACKERYPDISQTFSKLVNQYETSPIISHVKPNMIPGTEPKADAKPVKVLLDGGAFANWAIGVTEMLGPDLPALIDQAQHGETQDILASYAATGVTHEGDLSYGLLNGVACSEWVPYESQNNIFNEGKRAFPSFPNAVLAFAPQFSFLNDVCKVWKVPKAPASQRTLPKEIFIPTLIISGSYDGITSPLFAQKTADSLPSSSIIIIPGVGHFVIPKSACARQVMDSFLLNPNKPDTSCIAELKVPAFNLKEKK